LSGKRQFYDFFTTQEKHTTWGRRLLKKTSNKQKGGLEETPPQLISNNLKFGFDMPRTGILFSYRLVPARQGLIFW
jgi:hypothetical protein